MRFDIGSSVCAIGLSLILANCTTDTKVVETANQNADGSAANGSNTDPGTVVEVDKGISLAAIGSLQTAEDTSVSFPLNISTSTTGALQIEVLDSPRNGRVAIDQVKKSATYTPDPDFFGRDGFEIRVTDGTSASISRPVEVEVTPVDDAPVCVGLVFGAKGVTEIESQLACQDIDSPSLTYGIQTGAQFGAVTLSGSIFYYKLAENQTEIDRFYVTASAGGQVSEPVEILIDPTTVGETPVVSPFSVTGDEDESIQVQLSAETQNPFAGVVFELTSQPAHMNATFDLALGQVTLGAKNDHWHGRDSFKYRARSGDKWSPEATVSVTVNPVNDAPELQISGLTVNEDGVATAEIDEDSSVEFSISAMDVEGSSLAASVVANNAPANGTVTIDQENFSVRYQPNANFHGTDSFQLEVCEVGDDSTKKLCSEAKKGVQVAVESVNDTPIANEISITVIEDATDKVCVSVRGQASDVEDNQNDLKITFNNNWKDYINAGLSLTANNDTEKPLHVCFLPAANLDQGFSVKNFFTVTDANGATASANLLVSIEAQEDITEFDADSLTCTMNEDSTGACSVRASDGDGRLSINCVTSADGQCLVRDEENNSLTGWQVQGSRSGQSGIETSRGFSITPPKDFNGTAYIDMTASGAGNSSATATLKVVVNDVLDPFSWRVFPGSPMTAIDKEVFLKFRAESIDVSSVVYKDVTISTMGNNGCSRELSQPSESDPDHAILKVTCDQPAEVSYSIVAEGPLKSNPRQTTVSTVHEGLVQISFGLRNYGENGSVTGKDSFTDSFRPIRYGYGVRTVRVKITNLDEGCISSEDVNCFMGGSFSRVGGFGQLRPAIRMALPDEQTWRDVEASGAPLYALLSTVDTCGYQYYQRKRNGYTSKSHYDYCWSRYGRIDELVWFSNGQWVYTNPWNGDFRPKKYSGR